MLKKKQKAVIWYALGQGPANLLCLLYSAVGPGGEGRGRAGRQIYWSLCFEYWISMPWISDLYASNSGCLCLEYRMSASNIGSLCLEYRICRPWISDLYASNIEFLYLEYTYINLSGTKNRNTWNRHFTTGFLVSWSFRIQLNIQNCIYIYIYIL